MANEDKTGEHETTKTMGKKGKRKIKKLIGGTLSQIPAMGKVGRW